MTKEYARFATFLTLSDRLINEASKEDVAETARILALHLAHYRAAHGEMPLAKSFDLLRRENMTNEQIGELADGFGVLIAVMTTLGSPAEGVH